jgi:AcrR family transcriptional regulator
VPEAKPRDRRTDVTRARIAEAALKLFADQGYADTTIDQIADAAGVGRRTVFRHFATKEAILFDHFRVRREVTLQRLRERPPDEPPLASLLAVLREQSRQGYDRGLLDQIRAVLAAEPRLAQDELSFGDRMFEWHATAALQERVGEDVKWSELHALTSMAISWFVAAVQMYFVEGRRSLARTFDEVVATCTAAVTAADGA